MQVEVNVVGTVKVVVDPAAVVALHTQRMYQSVKAEADPAVAPVASHILKVFAVAAVAPVNVKVFEIASEQVELVVVPVLKVPATVITGVTTVVAEKAKAKIERRTMNFILILMRWTFLYL